MVVGTPGTAPIVAKPSAGGGTRTRKGRSPEDFKSSAFTGFATPAFVVGRTPEKFGPRCGGGKATHPAPHSPSNPHVT